MSKYEINELIDFIDKTPNNYYAVKNCGDIFLNSGFKELNPATEWILEENQKYFVKYNSSGIFAFETGKKDIDKYGFRLVGAHGDSPAFKLKPNHVSKSGKYFRLNTECYGGAIISTWLDRELSVAGRIILKSDNNFAPTEILINIDKPLLLIPNLAIHFNREINEGYKYNKQVDMLPFIGFINDELEKDNRLINFICTEENINPNDILDFDLLLYPHDKGKIVGLDNDLICSSRLDDLWMVHTAMTALIDSDNNEATKVFCCFDAEEVGSVTAEGANSMILRNLLERICLSFGKTKEQFFISVENSVFVSADLAHAVHPNLSEKSDKDNRPILGGGPVIKYSANHKYSTTGMTGAIFKSACKIAGVPYQVFSNRSDIIGGSTIGPTISSHLSIKTVDVGSAIFSMHSIRETAAVSDHEYMIKALKAFYEM